MPQVRSESEVKPRRRTRATSASQKVDLRHCQKPDLEGQHTLSGPLLSVMDQPSPTIGGTSTTHNDMLFWVGWFARFHTDVEGPSYLPYEIKTIDCPVLRNDGSALMRGDGQPQRMRCLREIARHETNGTSEWLMISWHIGVPGMSFQKFGSLDDAKVAFCAPPTPVRLP